MDTLLKEHTKIFFYNGVCEYCNKQKSKMFKCSRCLIVRYCSPECQKNHWSRHKLGCKKIEADDPEIKLSKIGPLGLLAYSAEYFIKNHLDPFKYPILEIEILKDSFFEFLGGKTRKLRELDSLLIISKTGNGLALDKKSFYIQISYKGKFRTVISPLSDLKLMMDIKVPTDPDEYEKELNKEIQRYNKLL